MVGCAVLRIVVAAVYARLAVGLVVSHGRQTAVARSAVQKGVHTVCGTAANVDDVVEANSAVARRKNQCAKRPIATDRPEKRTGIGGFSPSF